MSSDRTIHIDRYLTSMEYLLDRFDRVGRRMAFRAESAQECLSWQNELRARLREITGMETMQRCPPNPVVTERAIPPGIMPGGIKGHVRERVEIETEPGVIMPVYVLIPGDLAPGEKRPAVIAAHGHLGAGKLTVAGRRDIPAVRDKILDKNYDYGVQLVQEGFVVFCPDARGFGERREWPRQGDAEDVFMNGSCEALNHMAIPLGQTVTGMWTWDLMRLVDYMCERSECQPDRIGCAGLSGGGLQTLWLSALDERIRCAVISGYFYGYRDSLLKLCDNCSCNYVPHLWETADMGDIGALVAPRPVLIETGDEDGYNGERGTLNAAEQVGIARKAYALLDASEHIYHDIFHGPHRWHGKKAIPWLKRWLFQE